MIEHVRTSIPVMKNILLVSHVEDAVIKQLFVQQNKIESQPVLTGSNTKGEGVMSDVTIIDMDGATLANHPHIPANLVTINQQMSTTV